MEEEEEEEEDLWKVTRLARGLVDCLKIRRTWLSWLFFFCILSADPAALLALL